MIRLTGFQQVGVGESTPRAFGMIGGFPVEASVPKDGELHLQFSTAQLDKKAVKALQAAGKELDKAVKLAAIAEMTTFNVTIKSRDEASARNLFEQMKRGLEPVLGDSALFEPLTYCAICGGEASDVLSKIHGQLAPAHRHCLERQKHEMTAQIEDKTNNPKTIQGLIGGLLGGLVGAIPAFIALNRFQYFVFWLFPLIPVAAYYGWKLFGGKISRVTTVFVILYSILVSATVDMLDTHLILRELYAEWGIAGQIRLMDTVRYYFTPEVFFEFFVRYTLMAVGAAIFGVFVVWGIITKTDKGALQEALDSASEFVPIPREYRREEAEAVSVGREIE